MDESGPEGTPTLSVRIADHLPKVSTASSLVVGIDRRPESSAALLQGAAFAADLEARIHLVHAVDLADFPADPDAGDWEESARATVDEELAKAEDILASCQVPWTFDLYRTDPVRALLLAAETADAAMIVVGSRGEGVRTILERLISPSVTHQLVNRSPRPVLVIGHRVTSASGHRA